MWVTISGSGNPRSVVWARRWNCAILVDNIFIEKWMGT